jgi:hypothetical protein
MLYTLYDIEFWFHVRELFVTLALCYLVLRS